MRIRQVCVLGGSGFVGSAIVPKLSTAGYSVKVLTRRREASKHLILLPNVQVVECNILDDHTLRAQLSGSEAVINLVGILHETRKESFNTYHVELPRRVADLCRKLEVCRLLHMSALKASPNASSGYLHSKAAGETAVLAHAADLHITIFRPSVIFGRNDAFINLFAGMVKLFPVIPVPMPGATFQPVWVEDIAQAFVNSLENVETYGEIYELGGPRIYTLKELIHFIAFVLGKKRLVVGLNDKLSYLQALVLEKLPLELMSRDNLLSMQLGSTTDQPFAPELGVQPTTLEAVVPEYLANDTPRNAYNRYRGQAGR